jgi:hypothetical protein
LENVVWVRSVQDPGTWCTTTRFKENRQNRH